MPVASRGRRSSGGYFSSSSLRSTFLPLAIALVVVSTSPFLYLRVDSLVNETERVVESTDARPTDTLQHGNPAVPDSGSSDSSGSSGSDSGSGRPSSNGNSGSGDTGKRPGVWMDFATAEFGFTLRGNLSRTPYAPDSFPIAVVAYNRPQYLKESLTSLLAVPGIDRDLIVVFQDGDDAGVAEVVRSFGLRHVMHDRTLPPTPKTKGAKRPSREGAAFIARHYKFMLSSMFRRLTDAPYVLVVEDDMIYSPDFLSYFAQLAHLMDQDESLMCISSWNDNGFRGQARDPHQLHRTDFFIGLGWLVSRKIYQTSWEPRWPDTHWDHAIRRWNVKGPKQRDCIYPQVPRTYNIGKIGTHSDALLYTYFFSDIQHTTDQTIALTTEQTSRLAVPAYKAALAKRMQRAAPAVKSVAELYQASGQDKLIVIPSSGPNWKKTLRFFSQWPDPPARGGWRDTVQFWWNGNYILIASHMSEVLAAAFPPDAGAASPASMQIAVKSEFALAPFYTHLMEGLDMQEVQFVLGNLDQGCFSACGGVGRQCDWRLIQWQNRCDRIQQHAECDRCEPSLGFDQPAWKPGGACLLQTDPDMLTCEGHHTATRRVCPCVPPVWDVPTQPPPKPKKGKKKPKAR